MYKIIQILPYILLLMFGCVHKPEPEWITTQPLSNDSWYGIASVKITDDNYRENARTKAIQEIASQIEVQIQSSIKSVVKEINFNLTESYESIIKSRVDIVLPEVEILETYTKNNEYFIFTQLQKSSYYKLIDLKKEKVLNTAIDYISEAEENISIESLNYLIKALNEITPYIDYLLKVEYPRGSGKMVNLFSTIQILAQDLSNRFLLISDKTEIDATIGIKSQHIININCVDKSTNKPIANAPIKISMNGKPVNQDLITNQNGKTNFHLFKITDKAPIQNLIMSVDLNEAAVFFNLTPTSNLNIQINAQSPSIYLDIIEKNLDNPLKNPFVIPEFKSFFADTYGADFTENKMESDFYIIAEINTTAKVSEKNEYGLYQVYADGTISFMDSSTNKEIYQKSLNNVLGADFYSIEGAGRDALKKMAKKLKKDTFQKIINSLDDKSNK